MIYYRPLALTDAARTAAARPLAGGLCWFDRVEAITRAGSRALLSIEHLPPEVVARLSAPRADLCGLSLDRPRLMAILNTTPNSFSDGGQFNAPAVAVERARTLIEAGADILDIGGESTHPGAADVEPAEELARTVPVIAALRAGGARAPISIDTRTAVVARAALAAGAAMVNDVSAFVSDPDMAGVVSQAQGAACLMHAQGTPQTMQNDPRYDDVLLDVYDFLEARVAAAEAAGIPRARLLVDPGIGFGKTVAHNLALIRGLSLFHGLGCGLLLGASRKSFIGLIGGTQGVDQRAPGSIAVALAAVAQGVQVLRVHDLAATRQALRLWQALRETGDTVE